VSSAGPSLVLMGGAIAAGFVMSVAVLAGVVGGQGSSAAALASLELASQSCLVSGPVSGLSAEQAQNAEVIVTTAFADSGEDAGVARIALMVADTESTLRNLGPLSDNLDSLGLFQQRSSQGWGTPSEEMDPAEATAMFVSRLLQVPGWASLPPWQAAQRVQRSATSDGSNYQRNWPLSGEQLAAVEAVGNAPGGCGQGVPGGVAGPLSAHGLPDGYGIPAGTPPGHAQVVAYAVSQLGKAYVWAAAGPNAFDCSGLTMQAWATVGVRLAHYTVTQLHQGQPVAPNAAMVAGDLVLTPGSDSPGPGLPGHVGIYLGDGLVLSAIDPQMGVAVQTWQVFVSGGLDGVVDPAPGL
jgi:peptidoglycan DL-endopeptidase CwlO